jgi:pimeloyl-ACP methyl ester carboxylesterase
MPIVERNGVRLHTQVLGHAGPPVVMLHGIVVGALSSWYFGVAPVLSRTKQVLLYDLRGHGLSERVASGYGIRTMASDLADLIDNFSPAPVALVGHSYGAVVALRYTLDHPDRVSHLVIVEAPLPIFSTNDLMSMLKRTAWTLLSYLRVQKQQPANRVGRFRRQLVDLTTRTSLPRDLQAEPDISDEAISRLTCPVLLCYGTKSPPTRTSLARLRRLLPQAKVRIIEGGHFLPQEAPKRLAEVIGTFLDEGPNG